MRLFSALRDPRIGDSHPVLTPAQRTLSRQISRMWKSFTDVNTNCRNARFQVSSIE
jgi:hypothetical protein